MSMTLAYRILTYLAAVLAIAIVTDSMVWAMRIGVSRGQLILAGPVRGDETEKAARALDEIPAITTVIAACLVTFFSTPLRRHRSPIAGRQGQ
jgi:hypothetical protein